MKLHKYIGESSRSSFERAREHQNDMRQLKPSSHMLRHALDMHEGEDLGGIRFGMEVVKFTRTSFERQILESVCIQQNTSHNLLNSRSEYNRCSLPRLSTRLGDKEFKKYEKVLEEAKVKEENLERRIREMRKMRNRNRKTRTQLTNPPPKRRKTGENAFTNTCSNWKTESGEAIHEHHAEQEQEKRRLNQQQEHSPGAPSAKKLKMGQTDIRTYLDQAEQKGESRTSEPQGQIALGGQAEQAEPECRTEEPLGQAEGAEPECRAREQTGREEMKNKVGCKAEEPPGRAELQSRAEPECSARCRVDCSGNTERSRAEQGGRVVETKGQAEQEQGQAGTECRDEPGDRPATELEKSLGRAEQTSQAEPMCTREEPVSRGEKPPYKAEQMSRAGSKVTTELEKTLGRAEQTGKAEPMCRRKEPVRRGEKSPGHQMSR